MAEEINNEQANKKKKSFGTIFMIGIFAFLITVVIAGTFLFITYKNINPNLKKNRNTQEVVKKKKPKPEVMGPLVPITPEIIVNLVMSDDGGERYLKVNITLEASDKKVQEEITTRVPQIRDRLISILSSKTKEKIDQKEGKELIRREIIRSINSILSSGKIKNVYYQDFVIQ